VSVCFYDNRLYVANTKSGDVEGFWLNNDGSLTAITGSYKSLSAMNATPGEIAFSPGYHSIIVTEKMTNKISSFPINNDGSLGERGSVASVGHTPFGFDFSREKYMIVSNANADLPYQASCTSYGELNSLHPMAINGTVENMQTAACWVAVTKYGRFAFVANSLSNSISSYFIQFNGNLYVVNKVAGHTGEAPIDLCVSGDNLYVYNINSKTHTIGQFKRGGMGILTNMGAVSGLPQFAAGMAAF
jgi:6-phosphogluconolactonase (cycloisomerase 2 family)